jgi:hypothetical protein
MAKLTSAAKAAISVGAIGAVSAIIVAVIQFSSPNQPAVIASAPVETHFSKWDTETGHSHKHKTTYGRGTLTIEVSPPRTSVYLEICMEQKSVNEKACSNLPGPYESGLVSFEVVLTRDLHLTKDGPIVFTACAYRNPKNGSLIACSDPHEEPAHTKRKDLGTNAK